MWDPDGPGPRTPVLVIGGQFKIAGTVSAGGVASWDPVTGHWESFGSGLGNVPFVYALAVLANGDLVAGGSFLQSPSGGSLNNVARWNGTSWVSLESGVSGGGASPTVYALMSLSNGDLIVGGAFVSAGGQTVNNIARWDGSSWWPLSTGLTGPSSPSNPSVRGIAVLPSGDIVAGGLFVSAGGLPVSNLARWNGSAWSTLGNGPDGSVFGLAVLSDGTMIAAGSFSHIGGISANAIAAWNGSTWSPLGQGLTGQFGLSPLTVLPNDDVVVAGNFSLAGGVAANKIARWNGTSWSAFGAGLGAGSTDQVRTLTTLPNGDLFAGGLFLTSGSTAVNYMARWNGVTWNAMTSELPSGPAGPVSALKTLANGDVVVGGAFTTAGGVIVNNIARWNGSAWSGFGSGVGPVSSTTKVLALAEMANGDVVVGGKFTTAGGQTVNNVALWDGATWQALGSGVNGQVNALAVLNTGQLVVAGAFTTAGGATMKYIARWINGQWAPMGSEPNDDVITMIMLPDGDLVAGGSFSMAGGFTVNHIARWNPAGWQPVGPGLIGTSVRTIVRDPHGSLFVGGDFYEPGGLGAHNVARWNGLDWAPVGAGTNSSVNTLALLPNGDLIAGGTFTRSEVTTVNRVARWTGTDWVPLGLGTNDAVSALAVLSNTDLLIGGSFGTAGSGVSTYLARWGCLPCYPNCDRSTSVPILNANDFQCFLNQYAAGDLAANCDGSSAIPVLNVNDFQCFLNAFAVGCH